MVTVCSFQSKNSYPTFMYILISSLVIRVWTGYFTIDHKTVTLPLCYCYCIKNNPKLSGFKTATISFAHIDMNDSLDELRQAVFFWSFSWHWLGSFILLDSAGLGWRGQHTASSPEAGVSFHMPGLGFPRLPGLWGDLQVSWFWRWRVPADKEATGLWRASPRTHIAWLSPHPLVRISPKPSLDQQGWRDLSQGHPAEEAGRRYWGHAWKHNLSQQCVGEPGGESLILPA